MSLDTVLSQSNKLIPATCTADGRRVMIQLVKKGDHGDAELDILRYFSQPSLRSLPENHVIPLLELLHHLDMVFVVVPLLAIDCFTVPWFRNVGEAFDAVLQVFEVCIARRRYPLGAASLMPAL